MGASALNALRQPIEDGWVRLIRSQGATVYPARFQLVLAANPCPCGNGGDAACICSALVRRRYLGRLSGPLMDRIDLQVTLQPIRAATLLSTLDDAESSAMVRKRVLDARSAATHRWAGRGIAANAEVPGPLLRTPPFRLPGRVTNILSRRLDTGELSARGADRILRVAWTIVDLAGRTSPAREDIAEALELRMGGSRG